MNKGNTRFLDGGNAANTGSEALRMQIIIILFRKRTWALAVMTSCEVFLQGMRY